jgi:hypothetical protein
LHGSVRFIWCSNVRNKYPGCSGIQKALNRRALVTGDPNKRCGSGAVSRTDQILSVATLQWTVLRIKKNAVKSQMTEELHQVCRWEMRLNVNEALTGPESVFRRVCPHNALVRRRDLSF